MKSIISTWPLASRLDWFGNYDTKIIGGFLSNTPLFLPYFNELNDWKILWSQILILHNVYQNLSSDFLTQGVVWDWLEYTKIWMNNVIQYQKERLGEKKISEEKSLSIITYHWICIKYTNATVHFACRWNEVKLLDLYRSENKPLIHKLYLLQVNKSGFPPK